MRANKRNAPMSASRALAMGVVALGWCLASGPASAQVSPAAQCIASIHAALGSTPGLRSQCANAQDCMYQAPAGNASAMALVSGMADKLQECWRKAGLAMAQEQRERQGLIRTYGRGGESCKLLLSISAGTSADGYRAACTSGGVR
jgi:hypothetical protein